MSCNLTASCSYVSLNSSDLFPFSIHPGIIRSSFVFAEQTLVISRVCEAPLAFFHGARNEYLTPCTLPPYMERQPSGGFELNRFISIAGRIEPHLNGFYTAGGYEFELNVFTPQATRGDALRGGVELESFPARHSSPKSVPKARTRTDLGEVAGGRWGLAPEVLEPDSNRARDAVTLHIFEIDLSTLEALRATNFRVAGIH